MKQKRVFVTGGVNGIGRAIVEAFHQQGAKIAFCDADCVRGKKMKEELGEDVLFF